MVKIALNQLNLQSNPQFNFEAMEQTIKQNAANGARLSIFPEDFLYGVIRDRTNLYAAARRFPEWIQRFAMLAKQYSVDIIPGTLPSSSAGLFYNSTVYIDSRGKILTNYSKNNLWLSERDEYAPSLNLPEVFESVVGKTAIVICWDVFYHKAFEAAVKQGAEWIIVLAFWSINQSDDLRIKRGRASRRYMDISDSKILDNLLRSRTVEYNCGIIFCNFAGVHTYEGTTGKQQAISANRTQVIDPHYKVYGRLSNRKEATLLCELDNITQSIQDFEIHYGRREDVAMNYPNVL